MRRQAFLSLPLSVLMVLVSAVILSGSVRDRESAEPRHDSPETPIAVPEVVVEVADNAIVDIIDEERAPARIAEPPSGPPTHRPRITSKAGESAGDLAARVYGDRTMAGSLLDANPGLRIETWRALPPGTVLNLP